MRSYESTHTYTQTAQYQSMFTFLMENHRTYKIYFCVFLNDIFMLYCVIPSFVLSIVFCSVISVFLVLFVRFFSVICTTTTELNS